MRLAMKVTLPPRGLVLVLTGHEDPMWPFVENALTDQERAWFVFHPTDLPHKYRITYDPVRRDVLFRHGDNTLKGADVSSVWFRRFVPPSLDAFDSETKLYCETEYQSFYGSLEYVLSHANWVSAPSAVIKARSKALQLQLAHSLGFSVPQTAMTNDPLSVTFESAKIYKALVTPRLPPADGRRRTIFTSLLPTQDRSILDGLMTCPGIIQDFIPKVADIRVSVFGERVLAVRIESQTSSLAKVDFRRDARTVAHASHELPQSISEKCASLVSELGLQFGAIDLALLDDGSYVFFEINPNGQWGWLEEKTGQPLRRALIDLLLKD